MRKSDLLAFMDYIITLARDSKDKDEIIERLIKLREAIQEGVFDEISSELFGRA